MLEKLAKLLVLLRQLSEATVFVLKVVGRARQFFGVGAWIF